MCPRSGTSWRFLVMLIMWAGYPLLTAQEQTLDCPWGSALSWLIWPWSPHREGAGCTSIAEVVTCFTPWLQRVSHTEAISEPPKMGSAVRSAKFDHSSKHFETKESQENPSNNAGNDILLIILPYLLDHEDGRNALLSPQDSCITISNFILVWSQGDLKVTLCCLVGKYFFSDFRIFSTFHLGFIKLLSLLTMTIRTTMNVSHDSSFFCNFFSF